MSSSSNLILPGSASEQSLFPEESQETFQVAISKSKSTKSEYKRELIRQINEIDAIEADALAFMPRAAIYAAMPYRQKRDAAGNLQMLYERSNNVLKLQLQSIDKNLGIPTGSYPRILLAYMSTTAMRTNSPYIELPKSVYALMGDLGLPKYGSSAQGMRFQIDALRKTLYFIEWKKQIQAGLDTISITRDRMSLIVEESVVWDVVSNRGRRMPVPDQGGYYVKLSQSFFNDICESPVPIDMRSMIALQDSPLAMDLYAWLTYRVSFLRKAVDVSWEAMMSQFGTYSRTCDFKQRCKEALGRVCVVYPKLRISETAHGIRIHPSPTHVPRTLPMRFDEPEDLQVQQTQGKSLPNQSVPPLIESSLPESPVAETPVEPKTKTKAKTARRGIKAKNAKPTGKSVRSTKISISRSKRLKN